MTELKKELTLYGLTMVAVGSCIGSGIFITPSSIAAELNNSFLIIGVWLLGGIISLTGALTYAELGGLFPHAGGVYVYLKEAYGKLTSFLYGWVILMVITSGAIAALSLAFARFLDFLIPIPDGMIPIVGISTIVLLTIVNIFGVKIGEYFSNLFTGLKLLGILAIVLIALFLGPEKGSFFTSLQFDPGTFSTSAFGVALIGVLWSYGGWYHASFLAGEARNVQYSVPRAMVFGSLIVIVAYVLTNMAYMFLMPLADMSTSSAVAADSVQQVYSFGANLVAILIVISVFGSIGIYTLTAPRVYFAMARDKVFFKRLAYLHPRYKTPVFAIMIQSVWAIVLVLFWGTFENLITYVVFMDWIFLILGAISVIIFRYSRREVQRPYKTSWYPVTPLVFIIISTWFVYNTVAQKPVQAVAALIILGIGVPIYWFFQRSENKKETDS